MATLYANDQKIAEGRIPNTQAMVFSANETADVGVDDATPVVESIGFGHASQFTGKISKGTVDLE